MSFQFCLPNAMNVVLLYMVRSMMVLIVVWEWNRRVICLSWVYMLSDEVRANSHCTTITIIKKIKQKWLLKIQ